MFFQVAVMVPFKNDVTRDGGGINLVTKGDNGRVGRLQKVMSPHKKNLSF